MADDAQKQRAYTAILEHLGESGRAPHFTELAGTLSLTAEETRELRPEVAAAGVGCWMSHDTDYIASWAPFSNIPTQYLVSVDGEQKWYGQVRG